MEQIAFNSFDLGVWGILLISGILAFMRGFVREAFALGTWVGSGILSIWLYPFIRPWALEKIQSEIGASLATGFGLFCLSLIILIPLSTFLSSLVRGEALTAIDRSLGFVFGLIRGALILSLIFLCMMVFWPNKDGESTMPELVTKARTRPALLYGAETINKFIPSDDVSKLADSLEEQKNTAEKSAMDAAIGATGIGFLSTPKPSPKDKPLNDNQEPTYQQENKQKLDSLIERNR